MDIEKLIDRLYTKQQSYDSYTDSELAHVMEDAITALSTLQAENEKLRKELEWKDMVIELAQRKEREAKAELEQVKRERDAAVALVHEWEQYGQYLSPMGFTVPPNWREG